MRGNVVSTRWIKNFRYSLGNVLNITCIYSFRNMMWLYVLMRCNLCVAVFVMLCVCDCVCRRVCVTVCVALCVLVCVVLVCV